MAEDTVLEDAWTKSIRFSDEQALNDEEYKFIREHLRDYAREARDAKRNYEICKDRYDRLIDESVVKLKELGFIKEPKKA